MFCSCVYVRCVSYVCRCLTLVSFDFSFPDKKNAGSAVEGQNREEVRVPGKEYNTYFIWVEFQDRIIYTAMVYVAVAEAAYILQYHILRLQRLPYVTSQILGHKHKQINATPHIYRVYALQRCIKVIFPNETDIFKVE